MEDEQRNYEPDVAPETRPRFGVIQGGGDSSPRRGNLRAVNDTSADLNNQEGNAAKLRALPGGGESTPDRGNLQLLRDGEAQPWTNKVVAPAANPATKTLQKLPLIKKAGPIGGLAAILIGTFIWAAMFSPAMLLVHIKETLVNKFDTQQISANTRMQKVLNNKISGALAKASCNLAEYTCRVSKPSNYMLERMKENGIEAFNDSKQPIDIGTGAYPKESPTQYRFTNSTGEQKWIPADEFANTFKSDASFRAAFHDAWNPTTALYDKADTAFKAIMERFGFGKADVLADAPDTKTATGELNTDVAGEEIGAKAAVQEGTTAEETLLKKLFGTTVSDLFDKLAHSTRYSGALGIVGGGVCILGNLPGLAVTTVRTYELAQVIRLAMVYLVAADAIKAGHATPAEIAMLGAALTTVVKDAKGNVTSQAAVDSDGMKYAFGFLKGSSPTSATKGHNISDFQPGGSVVKSLGPVLQVTESSTVKQACAVATSPVTGAALDTAAAAGAGETFGATLALQGVNIALGLAIAKTLEIIMPPIIDAAVSAIPLDSIMNYFVGDFTQNLDSESTGNAYASGAANMMALTANAGGNMPMTVSDAVAYNDLGQQDRLAYAQEDRATHSPFDMTNQNTLLGSITAQLIPYYTKMSSLTDVFSTMGTMLTGSLSGAMRLSVAGASGVTASDFFGCQDPNLTKDNLAVGPFCNVYYGVPTQYLSKDPMQVIKDLSDQIDPNTGDPLPDSDLANWTTLCMDGSNNEASNCTITRQREADFALYTIDHRLQRNMDHEATADTASTPTASTASGSGSQTGVMIGDVGKQYFTCAEWIDQFVLPTYFHIQNPGGNGMDAATNLGKMGYTVNNTPAVHAIVSWPAGGVSGSPANQAYGHVAIVYQVNADGSIEVEEHNYTYPDKYDTRHVDAGPASQLMYAHTESQFKAP